MITTLWRCSSQPCLSRSASDPGRRPSRLPPERTCLLGASAGSCQWPGLVADLDALMLH